MSRLDTVRELQGDGIPLSRRCKLLGVNRSSIYYASEKAVLVDEKPVICDEEEARMRIIDEVHTALPASGARKMARECTRQGYPTTRHQAGRIMEKMNVKALYPKPNTSKPAKQHPRFPYLLANKRIWLPNQVWATDVTYVACGRGHMYLTVVIDWYSRRVVGWALSDTLESAPAVECMRNAFEEHGIPAIINSDQGSTYTSNAYIALLGGLGIRQSMDGKGRWLDNIIVERWFRTLKTEHLRIIEYTTPRQLRNEIGEFIKKYNELRLHKSLDYITPKECYDAAFRVAA